MDNLNPCPHCQKPVELIPIQNGFAIICSDHNCLGGMDIHYGECDNPEIFKAKLISNWNKRDPEICAVSAAVECLIEYGREINEENQRPWSNHGSCCIDVLDEAINMVRCFTCREAVEAWYKEAKP